MKKEPNSLVDNIVKLLTPLIAILGLLVGIWQFNQQQTVNDKMEFKRKIWEKQLDAYSEIADLTSRLVTAKKDQKIDSLSQRFEQLYWGKLPLFEDTVVQRSLKDFYDALHDYTGGVTDVDNPDLLKKQAYKLIKDCQRSMSSSWIELSR